MAQAPLPRLSTGISGLDDVLGGGLPARRLYLLEGGPGVGKTTVSLQFLREGVRNGERVLYVTLSETEDELRAVAASHQMSLEGVDIYEVGPETLTLDDENTLYHPSEVELGERTRSILARVDSVKPNRVVIDSCSELRLLSQDALRFRRQVMVLKHHLASLGATVVLIDTPPNEGGDSVVQSLAHGVLEMQQLAPVYGTERRRLRIQKMRGVRYRGGHHDLVIETGGLKVFPRLVAAEHHEKFAAGFASSGLPALDSLLGGGLDRGTGTLILGPAGSGKSAVGLQFAVAAAKRGERVSLFLFEEGRGTLFARCRSLGIDVENAVESGKLSIRQVDPAELSPGEFTHNVRRIVEEDGCRVVVIDSLNGYIQAMPEDRMLLLHVHELLAYLSQRGVVSILVMAQHGMLGKDMYSPADVSYIADTVIMLRFFEAAGEVRKAISVVKKRSGAHESSIRELSLGPGIRVGEPLRHFQGVLSGVPTFLGNAESGAPLMKKA